MTDFTVPLLRRTPLLPGESLPSLVERLAQLNHYGSTSVLTWLCRAQREPPQNLDQPACPLFGATFLRLAHLTQLPAAELWAASAHRFTPLLTPSSAPAADSPWLSAPNRPCALPSAAHTALRPLTAAQYCPLCLQAMPYHRLSWLPVAITLCLEHHCLLLDRCPRCQRLVTVADIVQRRCRACQTDLGTAPVVSVADDDLGLFAQAMLHSWFVGALAPSLDGACQLPAQPPALLYRLWDYLYRRLRMCQEAWPTWPGAALDLAAYMKRLGRPPHRPLPSQAYYLYRAAFAALLDWPQGLYRFLDAYSGRLLPDMPAQHHAKRLAVIQHDWLAPTWRTADADFSLRAFVDYLCDRAIPLTLALAMPLQDVAWFQAKTGLWGMQRVTQTLDLTRQVLERFEPYGPVCKCRWPRSHVTKPIFERAKILAVQQRWQNGWPLSDTCHWLGLLEDEVVQLVDCDLLAPLPTTRHADAASWLFDPHTVADFFDRVAACVVPFDGHRSELILLRDTAYVLRTVGITHAMLIQGILDGILPAYKWYPTLPALSHIRFLDLQTSYFPDILHARRGWVAGPDFATEKGLALGVVWRWVNAGLIHPQPGTRQYFDRQHLEELAAMHLAIP